MTENEIRAFETMRRQSLRRRQAEPPEKALEKPRHAAKRIGVSLQRLYQMLKEHNIPIYATGERGRAMQRAHTDWLIDMIIDAGPAKPHRSIVKATKARLSDDNPAV
jgi:hypothetical protein